MPELLDQMYCSQQIVIPPKFPYLLKRYCKAAIKTQPYDLLRWSFEYFKALAENRPPPVKLRLEYPVYSTEGGLTRGCLKVLAHQLAGQEILPIQLVQSAWRGFCLDPAELRRILCLCEVHTRLENVSYLHFFAVAGGLLTKSLTHTMILLCETLTKEPDGGSAAIAVLDFLYMYKFLARMDASADVKYINGYREGFEPPPPEEIEEEVEEETVWEEQSTDDFWHMPKGDLRKIELIDDCISMKPCISNCLDQPILGKIERSPSAERAAAIERENYLADFTVKARPDDDVNKALQEKAGIEGKPPQEEQGADDEQKEEIIEVDDYPIHVYDEDDNPVPLTFYGEPLPTIPRGMVVDDEHLEEEQAQLAVSQTGPSQTAGVVKSQTGPSQTAGVVKSQTGPSQTAGVVKSQTGPSQTAGVAVEEEAEGEAEETEESLRQKIKKYVEESYELREDRRQDLSRTFDEIAALVDRFKSASYDLGMVAGRQMSITSGEFIVQSIEHEIMDYINDQIAILPDPDLKKKKAKPEEVAMIRDFLKSWLDENMSIIVPEIEEVEEEEEPIPEITVVYAVPGIGPPVSEDIINDFQDYALDVSKVQADLFMPRNIRHFLCPPLEKYIEYNYDDFKQSRKEEVATGGVITD